MGEVEKLSGKRWRFRRDIGDGWVVDHILTEQRGQFVVGEITVRRADGQRLPEGGLPSRLLRRIPLRQNMSIFLSMLRHPSQRAFFQIRRSLLEVPQKRPGRKGHSDDFRAGIAAAYVNALASGSQKPIADVAAKYYLSPSRVSELVYKCRNEWGLLTPNPPKGRPGGELTPKALQILKRTATKPKPSKSGRRKK